MSNTDTISVYNQIEATADLLISQLMQIKKDIHRLRLEISSPGVSTPGLRKGQQALTDDQVTNLLVNRHRRVKRNHA